MQKPLGGLLEVSWGSFLASWGSPGAALGRSRGFRGRPWCCVLAASATAIAESDVAIALVSALGPGDVGFLPAEQDEGTGKVICGSSAAHVRLRADGKFPLNCPWLCLVAREKCDG